MATFSGNAAGYRVDQLANGKIRVVDIDVSDGDTGSHIVSGDQDLSFDDRSYQLTTSAEVRVNTTTAGHQYLPEFAGLADGGYVATWTSDEQDGSNYGIYAQRYDATGNAIGGEFKVNTTVASWQSHSQVTGLADGGYVIIWMSYAQDSSTTYGIYAQRYDAAGNPVGGETTVNTTTKGEQRFPDVAALTDGGYVITWSSNKQDGSKTGVYFQHYDAAGNAVGGETLVNTRTANKQETPSIAALADGGFVITWTSYGQDGDGPGIYAQRYDAAGNAVGGEMQVNTSVAGYQYEQIITGLMDGGYVISWTSGNDIHTQRFDATGNAVGGETRVSDTSGFQGKSSIAGLLDGGYVLVWASSNGSALDTYLQHFDASGNRMGNQQLVSALPMGSQYEATVTVLADGGYIVSWRSYGLDDASSEIYARRFDADGNPVPGDRLILTGTADNDVINGGLGDQTLLGGGGDDTLNGGAGNDVLYDEVGNNTLNGGDGNDALYGGQTGSTLSGGGGDDKLRGGVGNDVLNGGDGNDVLYGGGGEDVMNGGRGNDYLGLSYSTSVTLNGGAGRDTLYGSSAADVLNGDEGNDKISGQKGSDVINGGAGDDLVRAGKQGDTVYGGSGDDRLYGEGGNDFLRGGAGDDYLNAGSESDFIDGGLGDDQVLAGSGETTIRFSTKIAGASNIDTIEYFSMVGADRFELDADVFDALSASVGGSLNIANFRASNNGNAADADDYILYEKDTGNLYYDADGNGAGAKVQFALIVNLAVLTAANFDVI